MNKTEWECIIYVVMICGVEDQYVSIGEHNKALWTGQGMCHVENQYVNPRGSMLTTLLIPFRVINSLAR